MRSFEIPVFLEFHFAKILCQGVIIKLHLHVVFVIVGHFNKFALFYLFGFGYKSKMSANRLQI